MPSQPSKSPKSSKSAKPAKAALAPAAKSNTPRAQQKGASRTSSRPTSSSPVSRVSHWRWWREKTIVTPLLIAVIFIVLIVVVRLASTASTTSAKTIDGLACSTAGISTSSYAHLSIYDGATLEKVPAGIGIARPWGTNEGSEGNYTGIIVKDGLCAYPIFTQAPTGLIHFATTASTPKLTLGSFFAVWHTSLSSTAVSQWHGTVTAFVNGKSYSGALGAIKLTPGSKIELDINASQKTPHAYTFPNGM